jgi:cytochrome d ubiquinol oxidase subunit I
MPFSLEGTAFFLEAIALGIFLYGWKKIPTRWHLLSALMVGISGIASGIFILSANSWMNHPTGFDWVDGMAMNIRPLHALFNSGWFYQTIHMIPASFVAVGLAVAGIHGFFLLKDRNKALNLKAIHIALSFACFFALIVPVSGHFSAQNVAATQPEKFAAMEKVYEGGWGVPYSIFGIKIPGLLSFLAKNDFNGMIQGLESVPPENFPPVETTHTAFLIMVTIGSFLFLFSLYYFYIRYRNRNFPKQFWKVLPFIAPLGFIALEAGWVVTEVGRQPWILYHVIKTSEAVTPMPGLWIHFVLFFSIYCTLAFLTFWLMKRLISQYQNAK